MDRPKNPLRLIVDHCYDETTHRVLDYLECGHTLPTDTSANRIYRRRCHKCRLGKPKEYTQ